MPVPDPSRPLSDLVDGGTTVMFMTMIGEDHSSRPLTISGIDGDRLLVPRRPQCIVGRRRPLRGGRRPRSRWPTTATTRTSSLNGDASLSDDRHEIDQLWSRRAGVYFDGKEDPQLTVLRVDVDDGEYWAAPSGRIGAALSMLRVAVTRDHGKAGDHGPVEA